MLNYKEIISFFDEYIAHYREFLKFEYSKADMINKGEIEKLSNALSTEQALIMKTNSYESKRMKLLKETNGATFSEITEAAPEEFRGKLEEQHKELSALVFKIKEINDAAGLIISERLRKIRSRTSELDVYDGRGELKREIPAAAAISKNV